MGVAGKKDGRGAEASREGRGGLIGAPAGRMARGACGRKRGRRGFTLMETMAVVAVMVILMGVAFPAIFSIRDNLRMMDLDAKAQQIYNATQNRLEALSSSGLLQQGSAFKRSLGLQSDGSINNDAKAVNCPGGDDVVYLIGGKDASDEDSTALNKYLFTASNSDGGHGASSISRSILDDGDFVVELNPKTGEVYSVFYWEPESAGYFPAANDKPGASPSSVADYYKAVSANRSRQTRSKYFVGYYDGSKTQGSSGTKKAFDVKDTTVEPVNAEEYYISIRNDTFGAADFDPSKLHIKITLTQQDDNAKATYTCTGEQAQMVRGTTTSKGSTECDVILDSMRPNLSFTDIIRNEFTTQGSFTPGANVDLKVEVSYDNPNGKKSEMEPFEKKGENLLFESFDKDSQTIKVSRLRHLDNLRSDSSHNSGNQIDTSYWRSALDWNHLNYRHIVIADKDIDFNGANWSDAAVSVQSRQDAGRTDASGAVVDATKTINPLEYDQGYFRPIVLDGSFSQQGDSTIEAGKVENQDRDAIISNMVIGDKGHPADDAGLFATLPVKTTGITLANPTVYGASHTGALAGEAVNPCQGIQGCRVTVGTRTQGGTSASGNITAGLISGSDDVGGLVGSLTSNVPVRDCDATVDVQGHDSVGGLVGGIGPKGTASASSSIVNGSVGANTRFNDGEYQGYVSVSGTGAGIGGLIGRASGGSASNSTVSANVSGASAVGGFAGTADNFTATGCSVQGTDAAIAATNAYPSVGSSDGAQATGVGGFLGSASGRSGITTTSCSVEANVSGGGDVGGFAGSSQQLHATNCFVGRTDASRQAGRAYPTVSNTGANAGGFVGEVMNDNDGTEFKGCSVVTHVSGTSSVGGFAGKTRSASYSSCVVGSRSLLDAGDGKGYPTITSSDADAGGMVGTSDGGSFTGCSVLAQVTGKDEVGGFAGNVSAGAASSSTVGPQSANDVLGGSYPTVASSGGSNVGGFIGRLASKTLRDQAIHDSWVKIDSCNAKVDISVSGGSGNGGSNIGGFVGRASGGTITSCQSGGRKVVGSGYLSVSSATNRRSANAGGFVGYSDYGAEYVDCSAEMDVSANQRHVGGFAGNFKGSTATRCAATSDPDAGWTTVGLAGDSSGVDRMGGFAGFMDRDASSGSTYGGNAPDATCKVVNCYAANKVDGSEQGQNVGGFVGRINNGASVSASYSSGPVRGAYNIGGFLGGATFFNVDGSFTTSDVQGKGENGDRGDGVGGVGGFIGRMSDHNEGTSSCTNDVSYGVVSDFSGNVPTTNDFGGFIGNQAGATSSKTRLDGSTWLLMAGHDDASVLADGQPASSTYATLVARQQAQRAKGATHAFADSLKGKEFPFAFITYQDNGAWKALDFYGDWPVEAQSSTTSPTNDGGAPGTPQDASSANSSASGTDEAASSSETSTTNAESPAAAVSALRLGFHNILEALPWA